MKLWQKIFLTTLALVIILVNTTSLILTNSNQSLTLEREQQTAIARHGSLSRELFYRVRNTQWSERTIQLPAASMRSLLTEVIDSQTGELSGASLFLDGTRVLGNNSLDDEIEQRLLREADYSSLITRVGDRVYLVVVSSTQLNNSSYQLVSNYDITTTYQLFDQAFNQVRIIGIVSALFIAGVLLALVRGLLHPLRSLSNTTRQIASGDFEKRAHVNGNDEVAEVARDFNSMADSIGDNIAALEQLAESRKVFIGNLAHEMKTPLTSILGYADLLRVQRQVSEIDRMEFANVIVNETKRLQTLSGKLMELLSVGSMQLSLEPIDLYGLVSEMTVSLQPLFVTRKMDLVCRVPVDNCVALADRELLQSLILNLVDNAMKASTEGSTITIAARDVLRQKKDSSVGPERRIVVGVIDDGIGISADQIPYLTEPFYMLDKARTRKHGGAGLGLALCAEIARAHGSELFIESEIGIGTTVSCDFAAVEVAGRGAGGAGGEARGGAGAGDARGVDARSASGELDIDPVLIAGDENTRFTAYDERLWHPSRNTEAKVEEDDLDVEPEGAPVAEPEGVPKGGGQ